MKRKIKGFSFFEILLVAIIIGLLFMVLGRLFVPTSKNKIYSEICMYTIYGKVRNYVNKGIMGKSIVSGSMQVYPEEYWITFDHSGNSITFLYVYYTGSTVSTGVYERVYLTGMQKTIKECEGRGYYVFFTGNVRSVRVMKNLKEKIGQPSFSLEGTAQGSTGGLFFFLSENEGLSKRHFYSIIFDTRIQNVFPQKCISLPQDISKPCPTGMRIQ